MDRLKNFCKKNFLSSAISGKPNSFKGNKDQITIANNSELQKVK